MRRSMTAALLAVAALAAGCTHSRSSAKPTTTIAAARPITLALAGRPSAVTVAGGLVWVADDEQGTVVTVDEKSGQLVGDPIKVGPGPIALASDDSTVWVADAGGVLTRIAVSDRSVSTALAIQGTFSSVAVANGVAWATDVENGRLWPVGLNITAGGPASGVPVAQGAVRVAVEGLSVWVTNGENTVTRVDAAHLAADPPVAVGTGPIGLAVHDGVVWVANSEDDDVSRVVAGATGPTPATPVAKAPVAIAAAADGVWVLSQDARVLTRLDPATGKVKGSTPIATRPRGVALGSDRVWVVGVEPSVVIGVLRSALGGAA